MAWCKERRRSVWRARHRATRQGLAERAARAGVIDTAKAPDAHPQNKSLPQTGNVAEAAPVVAVNTRRPNTAGRTGSIFLVQLYLKCQAGALRIDPIDDVETWEEL